MVLASVGLNGKDIDRALFTAWLQTVVHNARIDYIRSIRTHEVPVDDIQSMLDEKEPYYDSPQIESAEPFAYAERFHFTNEALEAAFITLPLYQQRVLALLYVDELSVKEIAEQLACSAQSVYNAKSIAIKRLRVLLIKEN